MKINNEKCKIKVEFQAEDDSTIEFAVRYLAYSINHITSMADVTAITDIPIKYYPKIKS